MLSQLLLQRSLWALERSEKIPWNNLLFPGLRFYIEASDQVTDWIVGRRSPIHWFVNTQLWELREQVYRDLISPTEAVEELQTRALAEWDAQGLE